MSKIKPLINNMPTLHQKTPSLHDRLIDSLMRLNDKGHLTYLIKELNGRICKPAETFITIFLCVYCHPNIMSHPQKLQLQQLCQNCLLSIDHKQLSRVLNRPKNKSVKLLFDRFAHYVVEHDHHLKTGQLQPKKGLRRAHKPL